MAANSGGGGSSGAIRAGRAFVEVLWNDNALKRGLANAQNMMRSAGGLIAKAGVAMAGGATAAGGAIAGLFAAAVGRDEGVYRLSQRIGVTAEKLSAFEYAAGTTGQSIQDLGGHWENLAERILQAAAGTGEAADAFRSIGLDPLKLKSMDAVDQLIEISRAMKHLTNDTERRGVLSGFGGDQFQGLNELFKLGPDKIRELMVRAGQVGAVVTSQNAAAANDLGGLWGDMKAAAGGALRSLGEALFPFGPQLKGIANGVVELLASFRQWVAENKEVVTGVALGVALAAALGGSLIAVGLGLKVAAAAGGAFAAVLGVVKAIAVGLYTILLLPFVSLPALIAAAGVAWLAFTESGREMAGAFISWLLSVFGDTIANVKASWSGVVSALGRGDLKLAFQIAIGGIRVEWSRLVLWLTEKWNAFKRTFLDGWRDLVLAFTNLWSSAVHGTADLLTDLGEMTGIYTEKEAADIKQVMNEDAIRERKDRLNARIKQQAAADAARIDGRDGAAADLAAAEKDQKYLLLQNAFRQTFANMAAAEKEKAGGKPGGDKLSSQLAGVQNQVKGTFAGSAGQGFFQSGFSGLQQAAEGQLAAQQNAVGLLGQVLRAIQNLPPIAFG